MLTLGRTVCLRLRSKLVVNITGPNRSLGVVVMHQCRNANAWCRGYRRCTVQELDLVTLRADKRCAHDSSLTESNKIVQATAPRKVLHFEPDSLTSEMWSEMRVNIDDSWLGW
jgi:hypothetical protein